MKTKKSNPSKSPFDLKGDLFFPPSFKSKEGQGWILFLILFFCFSKKEILAQTFISNNYRIEQGNFNVTSGKKTSSIYQLTDTVGQNAPGNYQGNSSNIQSGFQYIYNTFNTFSFKIDKLGVNLGTLIPGVGSTDTNIITISTPSGNGYEILVHENHPLALNFGTTIPDTTCDNNDCSETVSKQWTSNSKYGFGFNVLGIDSNSNVNNVGTSSYFTNQNYYRQFADFSASENSQIIMSENSPANNHSARITYKALVSSTQSSGNYQNSITFIAIPKY
jgi:hypothetical protein